MLMPGRGAAVWAAIGGRPGGSSDSEMGGTRVNFVFTLRFAE
jgi:hypothetical protein